MFEGISTASAYIALFFGLFFLILYATRYYFSIGTVLLAKQTGGNNLNKNSLRDMLKEELFTFLGFDGPLKVRA